MDSLNIVRVAVPPDTANAARTDVVGDDIGVIGELLFAECTDALLGNNLPVEKFSPLEGSFPYPRGWCESSPRLTPISRWCCSFGTCSFPRQKMK